MELCDDSWSRDHISHSKKTIPNTIDISEYAHFSMYEPIYYWKPAEFDNFLHCGENLGSYLGDDQYREQAM